MVKMLDLMDQMGTDGAQPLIGLLRALGALSATGIE